MSGRKDMWRRTMKGHLKHFAPMKMKWWRHTENECTRRDEDWRAYLPGYLPPHFPVPALPVKVSQGKFWILIKNRWTLQLYACFHRDGRWWNYYSGSGQ